MRAVNSDFLTLSQSIRSGGLAENAEPRKFVYTFSHNRPAYENLWSGPGAGLPTAVHNSPLKCEFDVYYEGASKNFAFRQARCERYIVNRWVTFVVSVSNHKRNRFSEAPMNQRQSLSL